MKRTKSWFWLGSPMVGLITSTNALAVPVTISPNDVNRLINVSATPTLQANGHNSDFFSTFNVVGNTQFTLVETATAQFNTALQTALGPAPGYKINSAKMIVGSAGDDYTVAGATASAMLRSYDSTSVTFNNRDTAPVLTWGVAGGQSGVDFSSTPSSTGVVVGSTTEFTGLAPLVQTWLNGGVNNGLYFQAVGGGTNTFTAKANVSWVIDAVVAGVGSPIVVGGVSEGVTTDLLDAAQGAQIDLKASTAAPIFGYDRAIGVTGVGGETTHAIFSDAGDIGTVQSFVVRTPTPITLSQFQLALQQDGAANRSASVVRVYASNDNINYTLVSDTSPTALSNYVTNFGSTGIIVSDTPNVTAQFFRVETTKAITGADGVRINEFDGFGSVVPLNIDANIFNATTNTGGDEPAGLSTNFTFSASIGGDHPMDAFGNNDGVVETTNFLFSDGGTVDNGNGIIGDGGERVDFIQWQTTSAITLAGYEILLSGDGGGASRATELVRFLVEGVQVDLFDNNAMAGNIARLFAGGPVTGNDFRIEFTRTSTTGQRIFEINAILAIVPEPASLSLLAVGGIALMRRRRTV